MIKTVQARMICNRIKDDADLVNQLKDSYIELENKFHEIDNNRKKFKKWLEEEIDAIDKAIDIYKSDRLLQKKDVYRVVKRKIDELEGNDDK